MSTENFEIEETTSYKMDRVQEDFLFLDDVNRFVFALIEKSYRITNHSFQEVFNTFLSCGFVWQDKEFQMAKLKAHYICDRYMSTPDATAKV